MIPVSDHPSIPNAAHRDAVEASDDVLTFLGLTTLPGVGYWTLYNLAAKLPTWSWLLRDSQSANLEAALKEHGAKQVKGLPDDPGRVRDYVLERGKRELERLSADGVMVLLQGMKAWPERLSLIADAPRWLFVQGNARLLNRPQVAVVGTRAPTPDGYFLARYFVALLSYFDLVTVSGLAEGIDRAAHEFSLRSNLKTVAVLGTGLSQQLSGKSSDLRERILQDGGAVVTEYLSNQSYSRENFVRRNRIQAALADLVCPVEWKVKSGTAHTVRFAMEQRRPIVCLKMPQWDNEGHSSLAYATNRDIPVFAVPGDEDALMFYLKTLFSPPHSAENQLTLF